MTNAVNFFAALPLLVQVALFCIAVFLIDTAEHHPSKLKHRLKRTVPVLCAPLIIIALALWAGKSQ